MTCGVVAGETGLLVGSRAEVTKAFVEGMGLESGFDGKDLGMAFRITMISDWAMESYSTKHFDLGCRRAAARSCSVQACSGGPA